MQTTNCPTCGILNEEDVESWTITYGARPWTTNAERKGNRWQRADATREWRWAFKLLARRIPPLRWAVVVAEPFQKGGRLQDVAGCSPAAKAAIDGMVDAEVLIDDSPEYLRGLLFLPPMRGRDALTLHVIGPRSGSPRVADIGTPVADTAKETSP